MKSKLKFTPWFTKGEKPKRIGVYQASCKKVDQTGRWYSYWNGKHFCAFGSSIAYAQIYGDMNEPSALLIGRLGSWRGLATQTGK